MNARHLQVDLTSTIPLPPIASDTRTYRSFKVRKLSSVIATPDEDDDDDADSAFWLSV